MAPSTQDDESGQGGVTLHVSRRVVLLTGAVAGALVLLAAGFGIGRLTATRRPTVPATAELSCPAATCRHATHSTTTTTTTTAAPSTTATTTSAPAPAVTGPPTTTTAPAPIPMVTVCGTGPVKDPSHLYWCTSECSSYIVTIVWSTWGPNSATGTGTYVTKTQTPRTPTTPSAIKDSTGKEFLPCGASTPVHHPGTAAVLSDPQYVTLCTASGRQQALIFTKASWWTSPIPENGTCAG